MDEKLFLDSDGMLELLQAIDPFRAMSPSMDKHRFILPSNVCFLYCPLLQAMGQEVDKEQVKELMDEIGTDETNGLVDRDNFVLFQSTKSPTQAMPIALFFIQTLALIFKDKGNFSLLQLLNLDLVTMTKSCMMPMSATGTFFYKTVLTPLQMVIFSATFAVPFWNRLRSRSNWLRKV